MNHEEMHKPAPTQKEVNHYVYKSLRAALKEMGYSFGIITEGDLIVKLYDDTISPILGREKEAYLNEVFPFNIRASYSSNHHQMTVSIVPFEIWQQEHYKKRLETESRKEARKFLKDTYRQLVMGNL